MSDRIASPYMAVLRKELLDSLRDRRTLIAMILVPMLLFPVMMVGMGKLTASRAEEAREKLLTVAVADPKNDTGIAEHIAAAPNIKVELAKDVSQLPARIAARSSTPRSSSTRPFAATSPRFGPAA